MNASWISVRFVAKQETEEDGNFPSLAEDKSELENCDRKQERKSFLKS